MRNERELRGRLHVSIIYCCKLPCITGFIVTLGKINFAFRIQGCRGCDRILW